MTTGTHFPDGVAVREVEPGGETVRVGLWRWPLDPALSGRAWAASPHGVGDRQAERRRALPAAVATLTPRGRRAPADGLARAGT